MTMSNTISVSLPKQHGRGAICWCFLNSLTGPGTTTLPAPPGDRQLEPLLAAAQFHRITVIAGLTLDLQGQRQKGLVLFTPYHDGILRYPQGNGASLIPGEKQLTIIDTQSDSPNLDPQATLFTSCQAVGETAGGSPSVCCSALHINMPSRC
jgi:hypothetical protein